MLAKEHRSNISGVQRRSPIRHRGDKKLMELSYIYVFKELGIFMLFFKSTAAAWTSAIPAAISFFFLLVLY